ncbi:sporulation protein [Gottfriedia sp. OAE603]|uniref:sporulation protein n=1 Tax=Gottfriedia sp. OAE603 TaxID=2663872 RepID=UPI001789AB8A
MGLFKNTLARVLGIGGTRIDTKLEKTEYQAGERVKGELHIKGGKVKQELESVFLHVMTDYEVESNDKTYHQNGTLQKVIVSVDRVINASEEVVIPFFFTLSENTPVSLHKSHIWIKTHLEIDKAVDQYDADGIQVIPSIGLKTVIQALQEEGFVLRESENKKKFGKIIQEFEFYPMNGEFRGKLDELEVNYLSFDKTVDIVLQVDRKAKGLTGLFSDSLGTDEINVRISFSKEQITDKQFVRNSLMNAIKRYCK